MKDIPIGVLSKKCAFNSKVSFEFKLMMSEVLKRIFSMELDKRQKNKKRIAKTKYFGNIWCSSYLRRYVRDLKQKLGIEDSDYAESDDEDERYSSSINDLDQLDSEQASQDEEESSDTEQDDEFVSDSDQESEPALVKRQTQPKDQKEKYLELVRNSSKIQIRKEDYQIEKITKSKSWTEENIKDKIQKMLNLIGFKKVIVNLDNIRPTQFGH